MLKLLALSLLLAVVFVPPKIAKSESFETKLNPEDAAERQAFGSSVTINENTIVVGAPGKGEDQGREAAYVFERQGSSWFQQAKLIPISAKEHPSFGFSVATYDKTIAIGDPGRFGKFGFVFVFQKQGQSWSQQAILKPDKRRPAKIKGLGIKWDFFGDSIMLEGDLLLIGAPQEKDGRGGVYLFIQSDTTWTQQARLEVDNTKENSSFGTSVAISGGTIVVGASGRSSTGSRCHVFSRNGNNWEHETTLTGSDTTREDRFGASVAVDQDVIVVGAPDANEKRGAAYVFKQNEKGWFQQAKLIADDGAIDDQFGTSVGISELGITVGAPFNDHTGTDSGSAYLFVDRGSTWEQNLKLLASDAAENDFFAQATSIDGKTLVVGAKGKDYLGRDSGATYVYEISGRVGTSPAPWLHLLLD